MEREIKNIDGKVIVITGANSGETFANIVSFAISQPEDVDINEILFRPTKQEL